MARKGISIDENLHERGTELKADDESWNDLLERAFDALESEFDTAGDEPANEIGAAPLTEEHIDDIGAELERRLERTLENIRR